MLGSRVLRCSHKIAVWSNWLCQAKGNQLLQYLNIFLNNAYLGKQVANTRW